MTKRERLEELVKELTEEEGTGLLFLVSGKEEGGGSRLFLGGPGDVLFEMLKSALYADPKLFHLISEVISSIQAELLMSILEASKVEVKL